MSTQRSLFPAKSQIAPSPRSAFASTSTSVSAAIALLLPIGSSDRVDEDADLVDLDPDLVPRRESEVAGRYDAGSREKETSRGKRALPVEPVHELPGSPFHAGEFRRSLERHGSVPHDRDRDDGLRRQRLVAHEDGRPKSARAVVD